MGIREKLNDNPAITNGVTIGIIVIAGFFIIYQSFFSGPSVDIPTEHYYTVDDGATFFAGPIDMVIPFEHEGRQAVRAAVFKCDGEEPFVAFLEKYEDQAVTKIRAIDAQLEGMDQEDQQYYVLQQERSSLIETATLVKKPGPDHRWVSIFEDDGTIQTPQPCADGSVPKRVWP